MKEPERYLARCLDPVHVGAGGYQLGRVDMTIVREPATGIPKIPGTSLAGAVRAYAEMARSQDDSLPEIPIVFGDATETGGHQGMVRFYDADTVLFPIISDQGTIWISTAERLNRWLRPKNPLRDPQDENKVVPLKELEPQKPVNVGWLLLETESQENWQLPEMLNSLSVKRLASVSEKLFYHLVNDHLEVRTSVKINDETGAAESGALFTYEAIPRGTILGFEVAVDGRRGKDTSAQEVHRLLERAFDGLKLLGVGGMGTRGFGRLEVFPKDTEARS